MSVLVSSGGHIIDCRAITLGKQAADNSLQSYGLHFGVLNVLNEHGLIIADYNSWFDYKMCVEATRIGPMVVRVPFYLSGGTVGTTVNRRAPNLRRSQAQRCSHDQCWQGAHESDRD